MQRKIIIFSLTLFLIILGISSVLRTQRGSTDFDTYYFAAKRITAGLPVYLQEEGRSPYIYPPFFACLIVPLTLFNIETASALWYLLSVFFFALCLMLCFRLIFNKAGTGDVFKGFPLVPKLLFIIICTILFLDNVSMLQVDILIFLSVLAGLYSFRRGQDILAGLFLAMAISIKVIPIIFLIYFLIKREFKVCISMAVGLLIFSVVIPSFYLGPDKALNFITMWVQDMLLKSAPVFKNAQVLNKMFEPGNQSIVAFFSKWLVQNDAEIIYWKKISYEYPSFMINWNLSLPKEVALSISKIVIILLSGLTLTRCFKKPKDRAEPALNHEYSLIFLLALITSPILKTRYFIFTIFCLLFLLFKLKNAKYGSAKLLYFGFFGFAILYFSLALPLFKILGFGTLSILLLWYTIFALTP